MDQLEDDDEEEDDYDSDADLYTLDDYSVSGYELGIDLNGGGYDGKFGSFGGRNGVGFLSESDEEEDEMESHLLNA
ncbi:MAG: hypothetical protein EZS28_025712 [Streblomastix strix]|uniref:Uncharacterized protein n=1 Tax=Streblomastix strix TaxID=222440 RepID=A0A5J4V8E4_9EUKA|nr:MAG: hypothetical protein EZS28_025712 [Streblomastix strix]